MWIAAQNNSTECLDMLLRRGADANQATVRSHWMSCDDVVCVLSCCLIVIVFVSLVL